MLSLVAALVLVPTLARVHQQIEHRDATRLSIKHSWIGVAPPTKATIAPVTVAVLPLPAVDLASVRIVSWPLAPIVVSVPPVAIEWSDPLRGPPSSAL